MPSTDWTHHARRLGATALGLGLVILLGWQRPEITSRHERTIDSVAPQAIGTSTSCRTAADCGGGVCLHTPSGHKCTKHCQTDADCAAPGFCKSWRSMTGHIEYYCTFAPRGWSDQQLSKQ